MALWLCFQFSYPFFKFNLVVIFIKCTFLIQWGKDITWRRITRKPPKILHIYWSKSICCIHTCILTNIWTKRFKALLNAGKDELKRIEKRKHEHVFCEFEVKSEFFQQELIKIHLSLFIAKSHSLYLNCAVYFQIPICGRFHCLCCQ